MMVIPGYTILEEMARGAMAQVYLALQEALDRKVVLKVISQNLASDPGFKDAFANEGKIVAQLNHPHIVSVYDLGHVPEGCYIAMEYVPGQNLAQRIDEGLTLAQSLQILRQVAQALTYAHKRGVVHRDLKPANILVRAVDWPVLADFGIAKFRQQGVTLKTGRVLIGTPRYVSPERVQGKPEDLRSDLYSLGAVFYEMLTGAPPYLGKDALDTAQRHVRDPVPILPEGLAFLQPVLNRLMAKEPTHRFQNAEALTEVLEQTLRERMAQDPGLVSICSPWRRTSSWLALQHRIPAIPALGVDEKVSVVGPGSGSLAVRAHLSLWRLVTDRIVAGLVGAVAGTVVFTVIDTLPRAFGDPQAYDSQAEHVLERLLAYEGTRPTESLIGQAGTKSPYATYAFALAYLQGDNPRVIEGLQRLAERFEGRARRKVREGQLEQGLLLARQGLHFQPEHEGLLKLQQGLTRKLEQARRRQQIKELLGQAEEHVAASRLSEPRGRNAFDTYNAVLALDPNNPGARQGLARIAESLGESAEAARQRGDLQWSLGLLERGLRGDPQNVGLKTLRNSVVEQEGQQNEKRRRLIAQWLDHAQAQLRAKRLTYPPGGNAFETYRMILAVAPGEESALSGLQRIAERSAELARSYQRKGDLRGSRAAIEQGLQAVPGHPALFDLKKDIASTNAVAMGALLRKADRQFVASRLTEPKGDNALESYREVLRMDPGNEQAKKGVHMIVQHYELLAADRRQSGSLQEALALVDEGLKVEPGDGSLLAQRKALVLALAGQLYRSRP
ncbi:MAG: protein kinase domain-containing protein [Gammaproteobacteria bacterium]